jgi:mycothiol synthase
MKIEEIPLREASEEVLRELHDSGEPLHLEATPDDPRPPVEQMLGKARSLPPPVDIRLLIARDGAGQIAGSANAVFFDLDGQRHVSNVAIAVQPGRRREGVGTQLLARLIELAAARDRSLLIGIARESVPAGDAFAKAIGAELGQVMRDNRLDLAKLDRSLLQGWLEEGPRRAPGYSLRFVKGLTPPDLAPQVAAVWNVMNTAPRDDLQTQDITFTAELLAQLEQTYVAAGVERWAYYAVEDATGEFVGFSDIQLQDGQLSHPHVGNTGVHPDHRGHALGKWLKAAITLKLVDEVPEARWLITGNAASNDAMLGINEQIGFKPAAALHAWQVRVDRARQYLAQREASRAAPA